MRLLGAFSSIQGLTSALCHSQNIGYRHLTCFKRHTCFAARQTVGHASKYELQATLTNLVSAPLHFSTVESFLQSVMFHTQALKDIRFMTNTVYEKDILGILFSSQRRNS